MLSPALHDPSLAQRRHHRKDFPANNSYSADTLITAASDDQHLLGLGHLPCSKPRVRARARFGGRWKRLAQIERALRPERRFIKCLPESCELRPAAWHRD